MNCDVVGKDDPRVAVDLEATANSQPFALTLHYSVERWRMPRPAIR